MGSHARQSIDTSIVSQSKVQLIQCQCKSRLQIANLGINNAFLAATKQLSMNGIFCLSVCLSVRHTFLTMFPSSYHHEILRSYHQGPG